jgi:GNAT superfamily N-acetyltransferase
VVYLKDLFVREAARQQGMGVALMRHVAAFAVARGATRLEWSTGRDNASARAFYARLGARERDKVVLQAEGAALLALARPRQG